MIYMCRAFTVYQALFWPLISSLNPPNASASQVSLSLLESYGNGPLEIMQHFRGFTASKCVSPRHKFGSALPFSSHTLPLIGHDDSDFDTGSVIAIVYKGNKFLIFSYPGKVLCIDPYVLFIFHYSWGTLHQILIIF